MNKYLAMGLGIMVTALLFLLDKGNGNDPVGPALATAAAVTLTEEEKKDFSEGEQKMLLAVKKLCAKTEESATQGKISMAELTNFMKGMKDALDNEELKQLKEELKGLEDAAKAQGTTLASLSAKLVANEIGTKSIAEVLHEDAKELGDIFSAGNGVKHYIINVNHKGEFVMKAFKPSETKAAGPHAASADVGTSGNTASISTSIDAASLLRLGGASPIISQYRNTPWVFDLCNLVNAGYEMPFAMWYEESVKQGSSAAVLEGGTKPGTQYAYTLRSAPYKKEATLLGFTEEFNLDFARLQSDILNKGRTDLINRINTAVLGRITTAATTYNTATQFKGGINVADVNDFDALAAMTAQVDNATFGGASANAAVMSTFKKYRMGITKSNQAEYLNRPAVLDNLAFVGNPAMGADDVMVGDFKQYNIMLRGGLILRVGYNGNDMANNMFSSVLEQFYFDYISTIRAAAIVRGDNFATVKTAISS